LRLIYLVNKFVEVHWVNYKSIHFGGVTILMILKLLSKHKSDTNFFSLKLIFQKLRNYIANGLSCETTGNMGSYNRWNVICFFTTYICILKHITCKMSIKEWEFTYCFRLEFLTKTSDSCHVIVCKLLHY
jgi:hypothetical protein